MAAYDTPSLSETPGGTATHVSRVYLNIEEGFTVNVLDLVDSWSQLPMFEDGGGGVGRYQGHA